MKIDTHTHIYKYTHLCLETRQQHRANCVPWFQRCVLREQKSLLVSPDSSAHHPCRDWGLWGGPVFVVPTCSWDIGCPGNASQLAVLEESCPVLGDSLLGRVTPGRGTAGAHSSARIALAVWVMRCGVLFGSDRRQWGWRGHGGR